MKVGHLVAEISADKQTDRQVVYKGEALFRSHRRGQTI